MTQSCQIKQGYTFHLHPVFIDLTSCFGLLTDSAVVVSALVVSALGKSGL